MLITAAVVASLLGAVICRPPIVTRHGNFSTEPVSQEYRTWLDSQAKTGRTNYPPDFKFKYFSQDGDTKDDYRPSSGNYIMVVGSPGTTSDTLQKATDILIKMMKHTPADIFNRVANSPGGAGIFTAEEKLTIFPDFAMYADTPACKDRCDGSCSYTCTFDGRKVGSLAGVTASLALVLDNNVLCIDDPYWERDNILVHEFAHMVDKNGFSAQEQATNRANYQNAKSNALWNLNTYAMASYSEYFGEGTGAFFLVNKQTGGMTSCSYGECRNEMDARDLIRSRDIDLYNFLVHVWTNGNARQSSGLTICPT